MFTRPAAVSMTRTHLYTRLLHVMAFMLVLFPGCDAAQKQGNRVAFHTPHLPEMRQWSTHLSNIQCFVPPITLCSRGWEGVSAVSCDTIASPKHFPHTDRRALACRERRERDRERQRLRALTAERLRLSPHLNILRAAGIIMLMVVAYAVILWAALRTQGGGPKEPEDETPHFTGFQPVNR
jgi:hypothetical protein